MTDECGVIQVTNVAPTTTKEQMHTLFSFVGKVLEVVLYPESESAYASRMCYVKFENVDDVCVALHLSNTVFIDRAIVVTAVLDGQIPDENTALENHPDATGSRAGLGNSMSTASDEIRRTVYVSNLDLSVTPEYLMQLFGSKAGEIKYVRMAGEESLSTRAAFIEFTHQTSVMLALSFTGQIIADHSIRVAPAATSIVKPAASSVFGVTSKEIEDALKKVNDAEPLIAAVVDPDGRHSRSVSRKRSKSPRRRSKSKSRSRRSRSPGRSRSRSHRSKRRSKSRSPRRKSRSPRRHRSKSRSPRRPVYSRLRGGRRSRSRSPRPSNRSRRSRSRDRSTKNEFKMRDSGSRGSPRYDRSSVRDNRGERDARSGKESARSKVESSRHRSRSPGKRSGAKRSRSKSRSPRREKERDKKQNSSRDRSSRDVGRDHEKVRERDRDHDKEENRGRNERKKEHRESSREKERRGCSAEEEREVSKEKDEDQSSPITKKSRGDYEDDSDLVNDRAQINAEKMSGTDTDQSD